MTQTRSIDPEEVAYYERMAGTWWDTVGPFWPLHRLNELRTDYLRDRFCRFFRRDPESHRPLAGLHMLDVGSGGGILSEAMARLGARVKGIDVVERNIHIADLHARQSALEIEYRLTTAEALADAGERFDVVLNMEVVEHVADLDGFMTACGALVADHGIMSIATINRNPLSWLIAIFGAEYVLHWMPRGTHHYKKLRRPNEIEQRLNSAGLDVLDRTGVRVNPMNYPAASRRGINWSCSEIYDFHCNNLIGRSKLRGITPIVIQAHSAFDAIHGCKLHVDSSPRGRGRK